MSLTPDRRASITGWGKCLPPAVLTNADLASVMDTTDDWIKSRTGIKERRISHVDNSELAFVAGSRALAAAGLTATDVDLIITATCTPDRTVPPMAVAVQERLGAQPAGAFDLNATCSGFLYALSIADKLVRSGGAQVALVIGSEKLSYWLDFSDRASSVLFGDGAGAVVVEATSEPAGVLSSEMGGDGALAHILTVSGTGTEGALKAGIPQLRMDGREVFRHAVRTMADSSRRVLAAAQLTPDEIDLMIAHQANERIIDATARRLGFDPSRLFVNIASCGNTSSASIPIALADALDQRRITPEANLLFSAFGGGLTWAACAFRWGARVEPLDVSEVRLPPNDLTALELLQPNIEHRG